MTEYVLRVTIACPEAMFADANAMALCIGEQSGDDRTFTAAGWQDADGNLYGVSSTVARANFPTRASSPLEAPEYAPDVDLTAAGRAQAALVVWTASMGGDAPTADPDAITAIFGPATERAKDHLALMGLTRVEDDEPIP